MRRIYESEALRRDDDDPFVPNGADDSRYRSVNWRNVSHALAPRGLRARAIDVSIETSRDRYSTKQPVDFHVVFRNRLPFPVSIETNSRVPWTWEIDGVREASRYDEAVPDGSGVFDFGRSERKQFGRRWTQRWRESESEWSVAEPGEYELTVRVDAVRDAERLSASTTFVIE